jgi:hypothetical protein
MAQRQPRPGLILIFFSPFRGAAYAAFGGAPKDENVATRPLTPDPSPPIGGEGNRNR